MQGQKLKALNITEYNLIANKDPRGSYDRSTRDNLNGIIEKMRKNFSNLSPLENRVYRKFLFAEFSALEEKEKRVKLEVARYRMSSRLRRSIKMAGAAVVGFLIIGLFIYQVVLGASSQKKVEVAFYAGLNKIGFVSKEDFEQIRTDLTVAASELEKAKQEFDELNQMIEGMIVNNQITENLKYIVKKIYNDPRAKYIERDNEVILKYAGREIARYESDPHKWYLLGVIKTGTLRVYYNDEEILEIDTIFGRTGEETPVGEYEIKNKINKPTWYKKEIVDGEVKVRKIPFGHPDHEIGYWWLGLKRLGPPVPGSYGIHGVNVSKVNEFYKKNFDWRNGSSGCPNIQGWFLDFLARVVPNGARVNIVNKDKWVKARAISQNTASPSST